jgi:putative glutamine amidotransferase
VARAPLIGITGSQAQLPSGITQVSVKESYVTAVRQAGGIPVILAPRELTPVIDETLEHLDGVLLTGGKDVDPCHYGEPVWNETVQLEPERDALELPLVRAAFERDRPLLAICRGCQVLNVALGGSLWQDLPSQQPEALGHYQQAPRDAVTHDVLIVPGSQLAVVLDRFSREPLPANTFHHQAVRDVAPALAVSAQAVDGTIEAIEAPARRFFLGVQWHPEELLARPAHRRLFEAFVAAAARR